MIVAAGSSLLEEEGICAEPAPRRVGPLVSISGTNA